MITTTIQSDTIAQHMQILEKLKLTPCHAELLLYKKGYRIDAVKSFKFRTQGRLQECKTILECAPKEHISPSKAEA